MLNATQTTKIIHSTWLKMVVTGADDHGFPVVTIQTTWSTLFNGLVVEVIAHSTFRTVLKEVF